MTEQTPGQPPKKSRLKSGCLIALGIFGGLAVLGTLAGPKTPAAPGAAASASVPEADAPAPPAAVKATARELFAAYQDNQLAAAQTYADKVLEISGTVDKIDESFGTPVLRLATSNQFMSVAAEFPEDAAPQLATMHPGAHVTVRCEGLSEAGGFLTLQDCALQ